MCRNAILDAITRALTEDTLNRIVEYLTKGGITSEDDVMILDSTER